MKYTLKQYRTEVLEWRPVDTSRKLGMTYQQFNGLENDQEDLNVTMRTLKNICEVYKCRSIVDSKGVYFEKIYID